MNTDSSLHKLEGSSDQIGGLIKYKKPKSKDSDRFKIPKISVLGLDILAATKRKLKDEQENKANKRSTIRSFQKDWDEDVEPDESDSKVRKHEHER